MLSPHRFGAVGFKGDLTATPFVPPEKSNVPNQALKRELTSFCVKQYLAVVVEGQVNIIGFAGGAVTVVETVVLQPSPEITNTS